MTLSSEQERELAQFPHALRALIDAELAAGNAIDELGHGFPAAPCGAYVKLSRAVTTRARTSTDTLSFYDRDSTSYSGEFTDEERHFFVLEPPHAPREAPDMDAIRERRSTTNVLGAPSATPSVPPSSPGGIESVPERFAASMVMDVDKWRDGIGYDLSLLNEATSAERVEIEALLERRGVRDWRDVEALATLDTPKARGILRETLKHGAAHLAVAVTRFAPEVASDDERSAALVTALETTDFFGGLTQALAEAEQFHPSAVVEALWRGARERSGEVAVHFVALLMWIHGQAESSFDMALRPYFLSFHTEDRAERERLVLELRRRLGGDPTPHP